MRLSEAWQKKYLETHQHFEENLIKGLRESKPKMLAFISPQNKIAFNQLLDIDITFAEYLQSVDSFSFSIIDLLVNLKSEMNDPKLNRLLLEVKPLIESATNEMTRKSKNAHDCIEEFSKNAFEYMEKEN